MIEKAAAVLERHGIGEGFTDGASGKFRCWCGKAFEGKRAVADWTLHVARSLRRAGVLR